MRITHNHLEQLLQQIADELNCATNKENAIKIGKTKYLQLEYASIYGGYRIVNVNIDGGGHSGAFDRSASFGRISAKEMLQYLEGILAGIEITKNN